MPYNSEVWKKATELAPRFGYTSTEKFLDYIRSCSEQEWDELEPKDQLEVLRRIGASAKETQGEEKIRREASSRYWGDSRHRPREP